MNITVARLTDIVSLYLGEYPDWKLHDSAGDDGFQVRSLKEMVGLLAENEALSLTLETDVEQFSSPVDFRSELYLGGEISSSGTTQFTLPEDFCRLHSLKMPKWGKVLSEKDCGAGRIQKSGRGIPGWMLRRDTDPWWIVHDHGDNGKIMMFGPSERTMAEAAAYIPKPLYDVEKGMLCRIDPRLLGLLAERIARIIRLN